MPSRIDNLLRASFRGVTFSVRSEVQTDGGRKIVLHEYPNSSERFIEDLGKIPPRFRVTAFVHGQNFQSQSVALSNALEEEGVGRLVMPTFGAVDVSALPFRRDASQTEVGIIKFDLEFAVGRPARAPFAATATSETVFTLGDTARQTIEEQLGDLWIPPISNANKQVAQFDIRQVLSGVSDAFSSSSSVDLTGDVLDSVENVTRNTGSLIRDGSSLSQSLLTGAGDSLGLFQAVSIAQEAGAGYRSAVSLFNWGSDLTLQLGNIFRSSVVNNPFFSTLGVRTIPFWPSTTRQRTTRNTNRQSMVDNVRINSLVVAMEQAAASDFQTATEVVEVRQEIEDAYQLIINQDGADHSRLAGRPEVRTAVSNTRLATLSVLSNKQQNAFRLVDVDNIGGPSVPVLTHRLYAETMTNPDILNTRIQTIRSLNPNRSAVNLGGEATVLQSS